MNIVNQSAVVISPFDSPITMMRAYEGHIEKCGRVAYKSEEKITDTSAKDFLEMIKYKNHGAVLEHSLMTVHLITDRGITHEIVRHRIASFTQESTRYCNYSKDKFGNQLTFIRPVWIDDDRILSGKFYGDYKKDISIWLESMAMAESNYMRLIELGLIPQQARAVLPNSLKTEIMVSANYREWCHIFKLRAIEKAAHPQMRALLLPLYEYCRINLPSVFDLGDPE